MPPAAFDLNSVEAAITDTRFAGSLVHLRTVTSTNTLALEAAQSGALTGVWIADEQTAGRGRGGHTWHSAPGEGLYLSALIRPRLALNKALWLSLATGLAARSAIAATTGITPDIRWPNDLLLNQKKCSGILVETASDPATSTQPATLRYAVIGIGINLNHRAFPPELEPIATSIAIETGNLHPREPLIIALLKALDEEITLLESPAAPNLLTRFTAASTWITNKRVRIQPSDTDPGYTGTTAGLDPNGFLLVTGDDCKTHTILSGGVREP
jgi:BirA family transcriptional regulator, biotin operon repressor / biotin---[acetyl-CoA-carboxylase] ligase